MTTARILAFPSPGRSSLRGEGEPVSPFRHLMPERPLTAAQLLHRRRMVDVLAAAYRSTRVSTASEYKVKPFPGSASSIRL